MSRLQVVPRKGTAALLIPKEELDRLQDEVVQAPGDTGVAKMAALRNIVEGWCAMIGSHIPGLEPGPEP